MARSRRSPDPSGAPRSPREAEASRLAGPGSPDGSWASTEGPNPLGLEGAPAFEPPKERPPVADAARLEHGEELAPAPPVPVEWTPERAAAVLRGGFFVARVVDPVARTDAGKLVELWRLDTQDALEAGAPLSRMMNRYAPVRTLAGFADEAELGLTLGPLIAEQIRRRGQAIAALEERAQRGVDPRVRFDGEVPVDELPATHGETGPIVGVEGHVVFPPPPEANL